MQIKIRIAIAHKEYPAYYLSKKAPEMTHDLDRAITFHDMNEAAEWFLNSQYAPIDKERYKYVQIEVTKRELEDEPNGEYADIRKSS